MEVFIHTGSSSTLEGRVTWQTWRSSWRWWCWRWWWWSSSRLKTCTSVHQPSKKHNLGEHFKRAWNLNKDTLIIIQRKVEAHFGTPTFPSSPHCPKHLVLPHCHLQWMNTAWCSKWFGPIFCSQILHSGIILSWSSYGFELEGNIIASSPGSSGSVFSLIDLNLTRK